MWITCLLVLAASQSLVRGYDYLGDSEEDFFRDLDNWNYNRGSHVRLNAPASTSQVISAAQHSLAAAKAVVEARKWAAQALAAAKKAADAASLAANHAGLAAKAAASAASRSAAHLSRVPGGSSAAAAAAAALAGKKPGSSSKAAAIAAVAAAAAAGKKPGSSAAAAAVAAAVAAAAAGKKPGSSKGAAGSSARPTSARATPTGTGSSSSCGGKSLNVELKFPTMQYRKTLQQKTLPSTIKLGRIMCEKIRAIFKSGELCKCILNSFRPGSVLADFKLMFKPSVQNAKQKIEAALKKGLVVGPYKAASKPNIYNVKGFTKGGKPGSKVGCKPCKTIAPGVKMVSQKSCPTGYCATLMINPAQVLQAQTSAAPTQPPASSYSFAQSVMPPQSPYSACPAMCQPSPPSYSCPPPCPPTCCRTG